MSPLTPDGAEAGLAFRDRPPNDAEFQRIRLTLSTYRDGSGQLVTVKGSQPGWRDFERAIAAALRGRTTENKGIFDVEIDAQGALPYGLSLKTSKSRPRQVLMELSNSLAKFWARLNDLDIDPAETPADAGLALLALVEEWHEEVADRIDLENSCYLVLTHNAGYDEWQLFWYGLEFVPDPRELTWNHGGKRIAGFTDDGTLIWEWYGWSGGQLKYYPLITAARWASPIFALEEPKLENPADKAVRYWPDEWSQLEP